MVDMLIYVPYRYIYIRPLSIVQNKFASFCMNRTIFRDLWVGGVLVKTCIIGFVDLLFKKKNKSMPLSNSVLYLG